MLTIIFSRYFEPSFLFIEMGKREQKNEKKNFDVCSD